ncbi:cell division protein FtsL [Erysipelothrix sp. HDW6C]|uniref:cell division protein FtsL n=1 Tax=Erysipelothrix sp. HDW6C TaxID=2714930 RepID=UPI0014099B72|nr:cell division protein FtsL [Erysipelothrix sp. HDW6C]QIK70373.1 cell division protein FtsL [Erysipelothrix sp. HDW6C]
MAKHVIVKKRKKIRWSGLVGTVFTLALLLAFGTQVFVRTMNQSLANDIQDIENQVAQIKTENEAVKSEILALQDTNRVVAIAAEAGLKASENTVTVRGE